MEIITSGRRVVETALARLKALLSYSTLAGRGVQLLESLLTEEEARRVTNPTLKRKLDDFDFNTSDLAAKRSSTYYAVPQDPSSVDAGTTSQMLDLDGFHLWPSQDYDDPLPDESWWSALFAGVPGIGDS